jgi:23S rRNA (uracil1939-C5)-methyltransferase
MKKHLQNIVLHGIHSSGKAVGYCGSSRIYADGGIPGEIVDLEIDRVQRGYRYGKTVHVVQASTQRVAPFCKHYGVCGGCLWQHIAYNEQLNLKREILQNALRKYNIATPAIPPVLPSPLQQGYRNKSEYAFTHSAYDSGSPALGFHAGERRDAVCAIDECYLQPAAVQQTADIIKNAAVELDLPFYNYPNRNGLLKSLQLRTTTRGQLLALLDVTEDDSRVTNFLQHLQKICTGVTSWFYSCDAKEPVHVAGNHYLTEYSDGLVFRYSPQSFYQPNPLQAENLCAQVRSFAAFKGNERVYDLYTGIGSLACHVARDAAEVVGIEGNAAAIADAQYNAAFNGLHNVHFIIGDILHTFNDSFVAAHWRPDAIILDPPRSGTLIEIKKTILRAAPQKIIYVSCNPVSLAFDLTQLCENYRVAAIQPVDMFPHTHHVETVVLLERNV